ncbi:hypothetical protein T492DRAFT_841375 [Pavlovales sp. CCMP2436]|nr:hypothetical protein T492DRAFT_841375 [Pavlovales sp. CCMP2436]
MLVVLPIIISQFYPIVISWRKARWPPQQTQMEDAKAAVAADAEAKVMAIAAEAAKALLIAGQSEYGRDALRGPKKGCVFRANTDAMRSKGRKRWVRMQLRLRLVLGTKRLSGNTSVNTLGTTETSMAGIRESGWEKMGAGSPQTLTRSRFRRGLGWAAPL